MENNAIANGITAKALGDFAKKLLKEKGLTGNQFIARATNIKTSYNEHSNPQDKTTIKDEGIGGK